MVVRTRITAITASITILCTAGAQAATEVVPTFTLFSAATDNVRLADESTTFTETTSSAVLNASLDVTTFNERGFITLEPSIRMNAYSDAINSDLEGSDQFLDSRAEYDWATVTVGFRTNYRREAIIRAELPDVEDPDFDDDIGVDDIDSVDSGQLIFFDEHRKRFNMRPYIEFDISERSRFRFQTDITEVGYTGQTTFVRTGYDSRSIRAAVIRRPNQRNRITATLLARDYEAETNRNNTNSVGIVGEFAREISGLWNLNLEFGVERSDYRLLNASDELIDNASVEYSYGVRARRRNERTRLQLSLERRQDGSAAGYIVDRNTFRVYVDHDITQRLATRIGLRAEDYSSLGDVAAFSDRNYLRGEFSLSWAMRPKWSLVGGYDYTSQEFINAESGIRSSSRIYFGVRYQGLTRPGTP